MKLDGNKQNLGPMWEYSMKKLIWENRHRSLITYTWGTQRQCDMSKDIFDSYRTMFESTIFHKSIGKDYQAWEHGRFPRGPTTWKVMPKSVWNAIVKWRTKQLSSCTKYRLIVLRRIEIRGRIVGRMLSDCPKMLVFGTHW